MTRYRIRTVTRIEKHLREGGPQTLAEIANDLGMEIRVVRNYTRNHLSIFHVTGKKDRSNLWDVWRDPN